jgi:hypothetical protein
MVVIPPELMPHRMQVPPYVTTDEEMERFKLCFAITRQICGRDDLIFLAQLFHGPIPTDDRPEESIGQLVLE